MIKYGSQYIDNDDIKAVIDTLKSDYLTMGKKVDEFENLVKNKFDFNFGVACSSGTAALHLALLCLNLKPEDEVIVPSITFVATANVVKFCGAKVVIADIEKDTLLIDFDDVARKINGNTRAVIPVDMAGQLCDYEKLYDLCKPYYIAIISDACHSFGVNYYKKNKAPDFVCFSFHPLKTITTGEGGMVLTNNEFYQDVMLRYRNHGRNYFNNIIQLGYNYRIPDINCALGISQFKKLDTFLEKRKLIAEQYIKSKLGKYSLKVRNKTSNHLFIIKCKNDKVTLMNYLKRKGIGSQINYRPLYEHPISGIHIDHIRRSAYPNTEQVKEKILSIPIHFNLSTLEVNEIINVIMGVIE